MHSAPVIRGEAGSAMLFHESGQPLRDIKIVPPVVSGVDIDFRFRHNIACFDVVIVHHTGRLNDP